MKKLVLLAVATLVLSGCAGTVNIDPAPDANNPTCAEVIVRLPNTVEGLGKRVTGSQATAAWGDPASVLLRCGLEPVFSSRLTCVTHAGIDWIVDDTEAPNYRFITFGRSPAAEVIMDSKILSGASVLDAIAPSMKYLPSTRNCG